MADAGGTSKGLNPRSISADRMTGLVLAAAIMVGFASVSYRTPAGHIGSFGCMQE